MARVSALDALPRAAGRRPPELRRTVSARLHPAAVALAILLILGAGAGFRFLNLNWDAGQHLHPDERFMVMVDNGISWPNSLAQYFDSARSPLNPYNRGFGSFVYGTLPLFLIKAVATLFHRDTYDGVLVLGRALSGLSDLGSVWLLFLAGRRLYGAVTALLAGAFLAMSVLGIQLSHFMTVDSFTVFFLMLSFYFAVRVMQGSGWWSAALMGLAFGMALACKLSIALVPILMVGAIVLRLIADFERLSYAGGADKLSAGAGPSGKDARDRLPELETQTTTDGGTMPLQGDEEMAARSGWRFPRSESLLDGAMLLLVALVAAAAAFRIFQPYAFDGWLGLSQKWLQDETQQKAYISGTVDVPFLLQWAHTTPILFPLKDIVLWGMGWPLGLLCLAGLVVAGYQLLWQRRAVHLLAVSWIAPNLLYLGLQQSKTMRYFYQLYPFLALLGAWLVVWGYGATRRGSVVRGRGPGAATRAAAARFGSRRLRWNWGAAVGAFVLAATFLNAYAFTRIYTRPNTRVAASQWIYDHVASGAVIATEHWDDPLPLNLPAPGEQSGRYRFQTLALYDDDSPQKVTAVVNALTDANYLVLSSNRLYGSIPRIPQRYPMTIEYYKLLFSGQLGFKLVHTESSYPSLFGIQLNDDRVMGYQSLWAQLQPDEAFTVYDHPKVLIYQKTADFSAAEVQQQLSAVPTDKVQRLTPKQASMASTDLMLSPGERAADEAGGTWSQLFHRDSLPNHAPPLFWWLAVEAIGIAAFPLAFLALGSLWDAGWLMAKPAGLLLFAYFAWIGPALHLFAYTRREIAIALAVLVALGGLALLLQARAITATLRRRWRQILVGELFFAALFGLFFFIRTTNPDLWHPLMGGEKPMDFAFLNATLKTSYFPPYDPWFAGGYINYYYFGFVIVGTLIKLLGIVPAVAYNLAVPLLPALACIGAFSVVATLLSWRQSATPTADGTAGDRRRTWRPVLAGIAAAVFVGLIGNLGEVALVLQGLTTLGGTRLQSDIPGVQGLATILAGAGQLAAGHPLPFRIEWWYWNATRVIPDVINEFPFFTFLYGDLHAHAIALPYTLLALAAGVALLGNARAKAAVLDSNGSALVREIPALLLLGLVIGALRATNTWDYPTYVSLTTAVLVLTELARHGHLEWAGLWRAAGKVVAVLGISLVVFFPYSRYFVSQYSSAGLWTGQRTELQPYLIIHGIFLSLITAFLLQEVFGAGTRSPVGRIVRLIVNHRRRLAIVLHRVARSPRSPQSQQALLYLMDSIVLLAIILAVLALLRMWLPLLLVVLIGLAAAALFSSGRALHKRLTLVLIGLGLLLNLATEFLVLQGDVGRMNTVFKFDYQVWTLWAIAAAIGLHDVLAASHRWPRWRRRTFAYLAAVLAVCGLTYLPAASIARALDRFAPLPLTDDGEAYMAVSTWQDQRPIPLKPDYEAITWLQDNVQGSPVILEGRGKLYSWASRVSIYTGLPTVLGWDWHEIQQRGLFGNQQIDQRAADVTNIYSNPSLPAVVPLLRKYGVRYVYVGGFEREIYPAAGLAKFDAPGAPLMKVYDRDGVEIFELPENGLGKGRS